MEKIGINIWDDYYDDGYVPEGEIQETYIYVEEKISLNHQKNILENILSYIEDNNIFPKIVDYEIKLYDSKEKYPNLSDDTHYKRYELRLKNFTHELRHKVLKQLKKSKLKYKNKELLFYSES